MNKAPAITPPIK